MIDEVLKTIGEIAGGALLVGGPLLVSWLKKKADKLNFTKKKTDIAQMVSEKLSDMKGEYKADRIALLEFSNGDKSVHGFPFLFMTMTYEKCRNNVSGIKGLFNKIPASWYVDFNSHFTASKSKYGYFFDDGRYSIDGGEVTHNEEAGHILNGFGIKSQWTFKISDNIGMGLVTISFLDDYRVFTVEEINKILGDCRYVSVLFNQRPQ